MTRYLVLVVAVLVACKKHYTIAPLQATATVTGSVVVITATCGNADSIAAQVTSGEAPNGEATSGLTTGQCTNGTARIEVPIAKLGKGPQTIHVRASDPNGRTLADTDLKVDASAACEYEADGKHVTAKRVLSSRPRTSRTARSRRRNGRRRPIPGTVHSSP